MRTTLVALTMTAALAACGRPSPSPGPLASGAPSSPSADPDPIAAAAEAFVATVGQAADGTMTDDLRIHAVAPDGTRRMVATLTDLTSGLADGSRLIPSEAILVSPRGLLTAGVDLAVAGVEGDVQRRLIVDLREPGRAPLIVPGGPASWGPDGRLAIVGGFETTFVDPARGEQVVASNPEGATISTVWAADGSGVLATRMGANEVAIPGIVTPAGRFIDGARIASPSFGVGRPYGALGTVIEDAVSDGPNGSDHALMEERADGPPLTWILVHRPGPDPSIFDHAWDAAGTGQWVLIGRDGRARLVHLAGPGAPVERATFEAAGEPRIVGVAPDGGSVMVAIEATDTEPAALLRVDASTGAVIRIDSAGGASSFAGWAAAQ
jgi:hypothetical protein